MTQPTIPPNDAWIASHIGSVASTGPFSIDFPFASYDDVVVTLQPDGGLPVELVRGAQYTIDADANEDGSYSDGTLSLVAAAALSTVTRYRVTTAERLSNFPLEGFFSRLVLNAELNRITMVLQDNERQVSQLAFSDQALVIPLAERGMYLTTADIAPIRAGRVLAWDDAGNLGLSSKSLVNIENPTLPVFQSGNVGTMAALKALVGRPSPVVMECFAQPGDGGGGTWTWRAGDHTPETVGTIVQCSSADDGRYYRVYAGRRQMAWYKGAPGTAADNTAAITNALKEGGVLEFTPGQVWQVNSLTSWADGTRLKMNGAVISDSTTTNGWLLTVNHDGFEMEDGELSALVASGAPGNVVSGLCFAGKDRPLFRRVKFRSKTYNPRFVNTYTGAFYGLSIGQSGAGPYSRITQGILCEDCEFFGLQAPLRTMGFRESTFRGIRSNSSVICNVIFGGGQPCFDSTLDDFYVYGGGNYAFQTQNLNAAAAGRWQMPYRGLRMTNIVAENAGWGALYSGQQSVIGTGKSGIAIASTDLYQCDFIGKVLGNCKGGMEYKYTTLARGAGNVLQPSTPTGFLHHRVDIDAQMSIDSGVAFFFSNGATDVGSALCGKSFINANAQLVRLWPFVVDRYYRPFDLVAESGNAWLCLGDQNGEPGYAGATAFPATPSQALLSGCTMTGHVITYTSIVGTLAINDVVFAGVTLADGSYITAFDLVAKTVTCFDATSGTISTNVKTSTQVYDGSMMWRFVDLDRTAAPTSSIGVSVGMGTELTLTGSARGFYQPLQVSNYQSLDNIAADITLTGFSGTNGVIGCTFLGTGTGNRILFEGCTLDMAMTHLATYGFNFANQAATWNIVVTGGRIAARNGLSNAILTQLGNINLRLDGGVIIESNNKCLTLGAAAVNKIDCSNAVFLQTGSSGTAVAAVLNGAAGSYIDWGNSQLDHRNRANQPGFTLAGSIVATGELRALDLSRAAAAPSSSTKAAIGEWFPIPPTATVRGYLCQAVTAGPTYTWKALPVA